MREKSPKVIDKGDRYGTSKRSSLCISWCQIHHTDQVSLKTTMIGYGLRLSQDSRKLIFTCLWC